MIDFMKFRFMKYEGGKIDDDDTFERLPPELRDVLMHVNGFIAFHGGFHMRGACRAPEWHALSTVWDGDLSLHKAYPGVEARDIPFAQDALGDQFLLRGSLVYRLFTETGEIEMTDMDLFEFLTFVQMAPFKVLDIQPLERFREEGGDLQPGQLLHADPPFSMQTGEDHEEILLQAVPAGDRIYSLAELARLGPGPVLGDVGSTGVDLVELAQIRAWKPT